nr:MAG TPA: hypothetical protein [Caudoviricetes sp.]
MKKKVQLFRTFLNKTLDYYPVIRYNSYIK